MASHPTLVMPNKIAYMPPNWSFLWPGTHCDQVGVFEPGSSAIILASFLCAPPALIWVRVTWPTKPIDWYVVDFLAWLQGAGCAGQPSVPLLHHDWHSAGEPTDAQGAGQHGRAGVPMELPSWQTHHAPCVRSATVISA